MNDHFLNFFLKSIFDFVQSSQVVFRLSRPNRIPYKHRQNSVKVMSHISKSVNTHLLNVTVCKAQYITVVTVSQKKLPLFFPHVQYTFAERRNTSMQKNLLTQLCAYVIYSVTNFQFSQWNDQATQVLKVNINYIVAKCLILAYRILKKKQQRNPYAIYWKCQSNVLKYLQLLSKKMIRLKYLRHFQKLYSGVEVQGTKNNPVLKAMWECKVTFLQLPHYILHIFPDWFKSALLL